MNIEIEIYVTPAGKQPYVSWENKLDRQARAIIAARIARLRLGNFGDCKSLSNGGGIFELEFSMGQDIEFISARRSNQLLFFCVEEIKGAKRRISRRPKCFGRSI